MVTSSAIVLEESPDNSLLTIYEARLVLNLAASTSEVLDDQIEMLVKWISDEIAIACNRQFGRETIQETFRELNVSKRLYVADYPIVEIDSLEENGSTLVEDQDFEIDSESGTITRLGGVVWIEPVVVNYIGGYDLPNGAPDSLKQAAMFLTREGYYQMIRGDASIRMVAHKESRIIYFDPNAQAKAAMGGSGGSPAMKRTGEILKAYTRFLA